MRENLVGARDRSVEIPGAIDGKHERQLLAGKREVAADAGFLDHEELLRLRRRGQAAAAGKDVGIARDQRAAQLAVRPERGLNFRLSRAPDAI